MNSKALLLLPAVLIFPLVGHAEMGCTSKDGEQYILGMTLGPQTIEVNSDFFELQSVRVQNDGSKKMTYAQKYTNASRVTLVTKDGYYPLLVRGGKSYPCQ